MERAHRTQNWRREDYALVQDEARHMGITTSALIRMVVLTFVQDRRAARGAQEAAARPAQWRTA